jgi:hypothetical protein
MVKRDVTCAGCGARFDGHAWAELSIADRIEPAELRRIMLGWPENFCIEVRRCPGCGREIPVRRYVRARNDETA